MSGHSKWSTIKRKKEAKDAKKGVAFTKVARLLTVAARDGGADASSNASLRLALEKAKAVNMPKDVVKRAIDKGAGGEAAALQEITFEGYGPGGVAILVEVVTDNRNRCVAEVRSVFNKFSGSLGETGSAAYIFPSKDKPTFRIPLQDNEQASLSRLLNTLEELDDVQEIYTNQAIE